MLNEGREDVAEREEQNALAARIARGLLERKQVGAERRRQERESWIRNTERARERYLASVRVRDRVIGELANDVEQGV
jgi:hypothetical protein